MPLRRWFRVRVSSAVQDDISGSFIPNGSGVPATTGYRGRGFTATWVSTGVYRITLDEPFANFISIVADVQVADADASSRAVTVGAESVSGRYFNFTHKVGGTLTDLAASGTANRFHFQVRVARSRVPGAGV